MFYWILYILPKNLLSYIFGRFALIEHPQFFVRFIIWSFSKIFRIDTYEMEMPLGSYKTLDAFFTRQLKKGIRPIQKGIVHPADSQLNQFGKINSQTLIQAKGKSYMLDALLGKSQALDHYEDGYSFTYYLCPTDYHRVHAPLEGDILEVQYIPGKLWPVNSWSVNHIDNLFSINERVVVTVKTEMGLYSLVLVGATNVGKISLSFDKEILSNNFFNRKGLVKKYEPAIPIKKGDELGMFHLGSTVIAVYEKNFIESGIEKELQFCSGKVRIGESLLRESF